MRDQLKVQELMDVRLDQRNKELCQLHSQSQADGAQLYLTNTQRQGRTDPIAIGTHDSSSYGMMMV